MRDILAPKLSGHKYNANVEVTATLRHCNDREIATDNVMPTRWYFNSCHPKEALFLFQVETKNQKLLGLLIKLAMIASAAGRRALPICESLRKPRLEHGRIRGRALGRGRGRQ